MITPCYKRWEVTEANFPALLLKEWWW